MKKRRKSNEDVLLKKLNEYSTPLKKSAEMKKRKQKTEKREKKKG